MSIQNCPMDELIIPASLVLYPLPQVLFILSEKITLVKNPNLDVTQPCSAFGRAAEVLTNKRWSTQEERDYLHLIWDSRHRRSSLEDTWRMMKWKSSREIGIQCDLLGLRPMGTRLVTSTNNSIVGKRFECPYWDWKLIYCHNCGRPLCINGKGMLVW